MKSNTTSSGVISAVEEIKKLVDLKKSADFNKCVEVARQYFDKYFNHDIQNLLNIFPEDHITKDGLAFWSGPKRAPSPISFDSNDLLHAHFITACANLIAFSLGIPQVRDPIVVS
jgi:ubiquitin-activating enzyme E1